MVLLAASIVAHPSHCVRSLSASDIILLNVKETGVGTAIRTCREKSEVSSSIVVSDGLNGYKNRFRPSHLNQASHLFAPLKTSSHILSLIVIYFRMIQKVEAAGTWRNFREYYFYFHPPYLLPHLPIGGKQNIVGIRGSHLDFFLKGDGQKIEI
jgi:hypothetical protein